MTPAKQQRREICQVLAARRIELGMTQLELSKILFTHGKAISIMENSRNHDIGFEKLITWAAALGMRLDLTWDSALTVSVKQAA
jgi:transcriptional regulator with XRE-family HTH domain